MDSVSLCFDTLEVTTHTVDEDIVARQSHIPGALYAQQRALDSSLNRDCTLEISAVAPSEGTVLDHKSKDCLEQSEQVHKSSNALHGQNPNCTDIQPVTAILDKYDSNTLFLDVFLQTKTKNNINIEYKCNNIHNVCTASSAETTDSLKIINIADF